MPILTEQTTVFHISSTFFIDSLQEPAHNILSIPPKCTQISYLLYDHNWEGITDIAEMGACSHGHCLVSGSEVSNPCQRDPVPKWKRQVVLVMKQGHTPLRVEFLMLSCENSRDQVLIKNNLFFLICRSVGWRGGGVRGGDQKEYVKISVVKSRTGFDFFSSLYYLCSQTFPCELVLFLC